jgi:PAS domain S-box-containing protein
MKSVSATLSFIIITLLLSFFITGAALSKTPGPLSAVSSPTELTDKELAWLNEHPTVRFAVPSEFPPLLMVQKDKFKGVLPDYINIISRRVGFNAEVIPTASFLLSTSLMTHRADVIATFDVFERRNLMQFTLPFMNLEMVIVSRKEEPPFSTLYDLNGKKIVILKGVYLHYEFARRHPQVITYPADTLEDGMNAIAEGKADAMFIGLIMIKFLMHDYSGLVISDPVDMPLKPYFFAVRDNSPELLSILNKAIDSLTEDEKETISAKWFLIQSDHPLDWSRFLRWIMPSAAVVTLLLLLFISWNRRLSAEISKRRQAEKKLTAESAFHETIIHSAAEGICVCHQTEKPPHIKFMVWNDRMKELTGFTMREINSYGWTQLCYPDQENPLGGGNQIPANIADIQKGLPIQNQEWKIRNKEGLPVPVSISTSRITSMDGKPCVLAIFHDLTAQKQAEKNLMTAKKAAETANQVKSRFLATMSHELRTPLNAIIGYSQILKKKSSQDQSHVKGINTIERCGNHLLSLINDLLDLHKIEEGEMPLERCLFNFMDFLNSIGHIIQLSAHQKGIQLKLIFEESLPHVVSGDERRLRQVLLNLLNNAVKFTERGNVIFIVTQNKQQYVEFRVEDTGIGIADAQIQQIFDPFYQIKTSHRQNKGTGLGLAVSWNLLRLMGSTLQVKSTLGIGSSFWFELKLPQAKVPRRQVPDIKTEPLPMPASEKEAGIVFPKNGMLKHLEQTAAIGSITGIRRLINDLKNDSRYALFTAHIEKFADAYQFTELIQWMNQHNRE